MKKYIAYYRKSTDTEDKQILSLDDQDRVISEFAKQKGLYVPSKFKFRESCSAKTSGRPIFNQVVEILLKKEASGVIAWKADRFTRNGDDASTMIKIIEKDIEVWTADFGVFNNTSSHKMMFNFLAMMAKFKIDDLSENTKRGMGMAAKIGQWPGVAPLGYLNIDTTGRLVGKQYNLKKQILLESLGRPLDRIEQDPSLAYLIKKAFELYAYQNHSLKTLSEKMYLEGLRTKSNKKVGVSSLERILKNPFYYGYMLFKKEVIKAKHEPIIERSLFSAVRNKLSGKSPFHPRPQKLVFKYRGILLCDECGCSITAEKHTKKQKKRQHSSLHLLPMH